MLASPRALKTRFPLSEDATRFILSSRKAAVDILQGKDPRLILIVGPCSIHNLSEAYEYARRIKELAMKLEPHALLMMRAYVEKPRTATGWKGLLYDPHLNGTDDIPAGIALTRELLLNLAQMGVPVATEFVDPLAAVYYSDLISWGFIGARTAASPPHRQYASHLSFPIGFKNSLDGNLDHAIYGVIAAQTSHSFLFLNEEGKIVAEKSQGNPYAHIVLRGSYYAPNYDTTSVQQAIEKLLSSGLSPRLMIDCAHGNSNKQHLKQKEAFFSVLEQIKRGNSHIIGLMIESYLEEGNQPMDQESSPIRPGISITDPCLDWQSTEELLSSL